MSQNNKNQLLNSLYGTHAEITDPIPDTGKLIEPIHTAVESQVVSEIEEKEIQNANFRTSAFSQTNFLNRGYESKEIKKSVSISFETDDRLEAFIKDYKRGVRGQNINAKMDFQDLCSYIIKKFLDENNF
jgi:hypothetical protein